MSSLTLTRNGIEYFNNKSTQPMTLQILAMKELPFQGAGAESLRYTIVLSDGFHIGAGILGPKLNYACLMGHIQRNTVLSITDVMLMDGGERTFVIVLAATVLAQSETIIGEPSRFKDGVIVSLSNDLTILNI